MTQGDEPNKVNEAAEDEPRITLPPPEALTEMFPASGGLGSASVIGSAEGALDLSLPDDPNGEKLSAWLAQVSSRIDEELASTDDPPLSD